MTAAARAIRAGAARGEHGSGDEDRQKQKDSCFHCTLFIEMVGNLPTEE
jgi:hypothetical protein